MKGRLSIEINEEAFFEVVGKVRSDELSRHAAARLLGVPERTFRRRLKDVS